MAPKKPAPKKAAAKVAAKKPTAKPVAKNAASKPAAKKVAAKPASKPVAKKVTAKPVAKKAVAKSASKPVAKKVVAKPTPKPISKKVVIKPASKPIAKKVAAKPEPKLPAKKVETKLASKSQVKVPTPKQVEIAKPIKEQKLKKEKPLVIEEDIPKEPKVRKPRAKKAKRIVRVPKPPKPVKNTGIEKATTVIPVKKIEVKAKEEPVKNLKVPKITTKTSVAYSPGYVPMDRRKEDEQPNTPMVRYSDAELNEFKELITKKLEAAKQELAYLQGVITHKSESSGDDGHHMSVEDGSMTMEREQMSNFASRQITFIDHLEKALARIENKTYGVCRVTGKLIDKARLRAVPHATLSLEAKLGLVKPGE